MKTAIVSAANAEYFPVLKGLIQSIADSQPDQQIAIAVLDVGLDSAQAAELRASGIIVADGQWDVEFPAGPPPQRWLQAMTARCHLPKYFPDFDLLIWIDADAWLQDWRAIDLLVKGAASHGFAIVPEVHRAYAHIYRMGEPKLNEMYAFYGLSFPPEQANRLARSPAINSGVFALRSDSQMWSIWSKWLAVALKGTFHKMTEQCALNAALYFDKAPFCPLPAWCNWICGQGRLLYDPDSRRLTEPVLPFEPVSIVHVTPRRFAISEISTADGRKFKLPLDYLPYKQAILNLA